jgi:large subunit ribosomal protein L25
MAEDISLEASERQVSGTVACRRLRREGWMPCVLNTQQGKSKLIKLGRHDFEMMLRHHSGENLMVDLSVDGKRAKKVLLKEVQHDPLTGSAEHADFMEVSMTKLMRVSVPVVLTGEPVGVTRGGGVLEQVVRDVDVECLPGDLVDSLELDISGLDIGDSLTVGSLDFGDKMTVLTPPEVAVALVSAPRVEEEPAAEEAEEAEPEVVGEEEKVQAEEAESEESTE